MDITYNALSIIKTEVNMFTDYLAENSANREQQDLEIYRFLAKRIIFFRQISHANVFDTNPKKLITDLFHIAIALSQNNIRYAHLNERSIIENYVRIILFNTHNSVYVNRALFKSLKEKNINDNDYSFICDRYSTCSNYIHGGELLCEYLVENLMQIIDNTCHKNSSYYTHLIRLLKIMDLAILYNYAPLIDMIFHRRKSILIYLFDDDYVDMLHEYK